MRLGRAESERASPRISPSASRPRHRDAPAFHHGRSNCGQIERSRAELKRSDRASAKARRGVRPVCFRHGASRCSSGLNGGSSAWTRSPFRRTRHGSAARTNCGAQSHVHVFTGMAASVTEGLTRAHQVCDAAFAAHRRTVHNAATTATAATPSRSSSTSDPNRHAEGDPLMAMSAAAKAYYDSHFQALREHGAMNAARLEPRQALQYTTVNGARLLPFPSLMPARSVAPAVHSAIKKTWSTSTTSPPATASRCASSTSGTPLAPGPAARTSSTSTRSPPRSRPCRSR